MVPVTNIMYGDYCDCLLRSLDYIKDRDDLVIITAANYACHTQFCSLVEVTNKLVTTDDIR